MDDDRDDTRAHTLVVNAPAPSASAWLPFETHATRPSLRLYCFPYAGAGASVYRDWVRERQSPAVCPVQLPGRETRLGEPRHRSWPALVDAVADGLMPHLHGSFALFGHSMGALLAYELARRLAEAGRPSPAHLFVSGRRAPQCEPGRTLAPHLRRAEARTEAALLEHGAGPSEVGSLSAMLLPILRDDFAACESHRDVPATPLSCPISAFGGLEDADVPVAGLEAWRQCTTGRFRLRVLPGDHFFLHTSRALLLHFISDDLAHP